MTWRLHLMLLVLALCASTAGQANKQTTAYGEAYRKWLREDVRWIITDQERADFKKLSDDKQRDQFVVDFWERRNPIPGAPENPFKEAHYRRLAYANEHFAAVVPGWKTDRGRFYIAYGPPDKIVHHPRVRDDDSFIPREEGLDWEEWHYPYIEGLGRDVTLEFVDTCRCGEYHLPRDPFDKEHPQVIE